MHFNWKSCYNQWLFISRSIEVGRNLRKDKKVNLVWYLFDIKGWYDAWMGPDFIDVSVKIVFQYYQRRFEDDNVNTGTYFFKADHYTA